MKEQATDVMAEHGSRPDFIDAMLVGTSHSARKRLAKRSLTFRQWDSGRQRPWRPDVMGHVASRSEVCRIGVLTGILSVFLQAPQRHTRLSFDGSGQNIR